MTLLGHGRQLHYLDRVVRNDRLAHAYLFHGPSQVGKLSVAKTLASRLYCMQSPPGLVQICGTCEACRQIALDQHPGVIRLDHEHPLVSPGKTAREIPIDDIRELRRRLSLASSTDQVRVVILDQAEELSLDAGPALLKILEEPGPRILFLLITPHPDLLPPTIASRTQQIRFSLLPDTLLDEYLNTQRLAADQKSELLRLARGRPGVLIRLLNEPDYYRAILRLRADAESLIQDPRTPERFAWIATYAEDRARREEFLWHLFQLLRNHLRSAHTHPGYLRLAAGLKRMVAIGADLETTNVNPGLALDILFQTVSTSQGV